MQFLNFRQYLSCWRNTKIWDKQEMCMILWEQKIYVATGGWTSTWTSHKVQGRCSSLKMCLFCGLLGIGKVFFSLSSSNLAFVPEYENDSKAGQTHFSHCCHISEQCNLWFQINIFLSQVLSHFWLTGGINGMNVEMLLLVVAQVKIKHWQ